MKLANKHICIYIYTLYVYTLQIYKYKYIYVILKTIYPPIYHHNSFVATHAPVATQIVHNVHKCMSCNKTIMMITRGHIYYTHLLSERFEHSVCRESIMTTYTYMYRFLKNRCLGGISYFPMGMSKNV